MGKIRVQVDFQLAVDVWLKFDCLKQVIRFTRDGLDVELCLPPFEGIAPASITFDKLHFDGYTGAAEGEVGQSQPSRLAIEGIRVIIREEVNGVSQADLAGSEAMTVANLVSRHQQGRIEFAQHLVIEFLDRLRVQGQTWLGPMGTISLSGSPHASTYEDDTGSRLPCGHGGTLIIQPTLAAADLQLSSFGTIAESLAKPEAPPLPESFLADAQYFLAQGTQNDLRRSVLLAAIACETKVKETLRSKVRPGGTELVDVLILNPRDFSMSAAGLFDKAMKAAVGWSLREHSKDLFKGIDGLFSTRNKIAHSGFPNERNQMERSQARQCVQAARDVFVWLDSLPTPLSGEAR